MAFPTAVNSQITDAVTQANVKVLADAPAMAMGAIYQSLARRRARLQPKPRSPFSLIWVRLYWPRAIITTRA